MGLADLKRRLGLAAGALVALTLPALADLPLVCGDGCPFWEAADRSFRELGLSVTPKAIDLMLTQLG